MLNVNDSQKTAIVMVGLPGSGKSTWINKFLSTQDKSKWAIISLDALVEDLAVKKGISYNEAWPQMDFKNANSKIKANIHSAINKGMNIIFDQTNLTVKGRNKHLSKLPNDYQKAAVVFSLTDKELKSRQDYRKSMTGKSIPDNVVDEMAGRYQAPTKSEGFSEILYIKE